MRESKPITDPSPLPPVDYGTPYQIQIESRERIVAELRRRYMDLMIVAGGEATLWIVTVGMEE
ncbi:hypothetical protein J6590_081785 [Homalodisca vitripennis]|nr:hypothetical protein J6590_081785 [Homalodisca vitripennis]